MVLRGRLKCEMGRLGLQVNSPTTPQIHSKHARRLEQNINSTYHETMTGFEPRAEKMAHQAKQRERMLVWAHQLALFIFCYTYITSLRALLSSSVPKILSIGLLASSYISVLLNPKCSAMRAYSFDRLLPKTPTSSVCCSQQMLTLS